MANADCAASTLCCLSSSQTVCRWGVLCTDGSQTGQVRETVAHAGHRTQCWHGVSTTDDAGCLHVAQCSDRSLDSIWTTQQCTNTGSLSFHNTKVLHKTLNPTAELWCKTSSQIKSIWFYTELKLQRFISVWLFKSSGHSVPVTTPGEQKWNACFRVRQLSVSVLVH